MNSVGLVWFESFVLHDEFWNEGIDKTVVVKLLSSVWKPL